MAGHPRQRRHAAGPAVDAGLARRPATPGEFPDRTVRLSFVLNRLEADRIALQTARFLKSRNPHSVVKLKDLQTGEETVVAFKSGQ